MSGPYVGLLIGDVECHWYLLYVLLGVLKHTSLDNYMQDQSLYAHYGISGKMMKLSFLFVFICIAAKMLMIMIW
jgi:hypothetical protein